MIKRLLFSGIAFCLITAGRGATIEHLTLEQAIDLALKNHPTLAEHAARVEAYSARAREAGTFPNPEGIAGVESAPLERRTAGEAEYIAGFSQPLALGGRLSAARKVAKAETVQSVREMDLAILEVSANVRNAFATALFANEVFIAQSNLIDSGRELIELTKGRVAAGDAAEIDLLRAEAQAEQEEITAREAAAMKSEAMLALNSALGMRQDEVTSLSGELESVLKLDEIASISGDAASHPAVTASEAGIQAQRARLELARRQRVPDLNLDLLYRRLEASGESAFDAVVRMEIPLFNQGKRNVRAAEAEVAAAEARRDLTRATIEGERARNHVLLASRVGTARSYKERVLPKLAEAVRMLELRYEAGDLALTELLNTRREYSLARLKYFESLQKVLESWAESLTYLPIERVSARARE